MATVVEKAIEHRCGLRAGWAPLAERDEYHPISTEGPPIPRAVLAHEHARAECRRKCVALRRHQAERSGVWTERVVGLDRFRDQLRARWLDASVDDLAEVAVRPTIEA